MRLRLRDALVAASAAGLLFLASCGDGGATRFARGGPVMAGGGGSLEVAIPADPGVADPLHANGSSEALVARQVYEPLVARVDAPYGRRASARGLALGWRHSGDFRVWSFRLRDGVAFQDGTPLDGNAVVANADRWRSDPAGQAALPGLIAADAPSPGTVRFILNRAADRLPAELSDPRLGLVSPPALRAAGGGVLPLAEKAGTGPFEQTNDDPLAATRNVDWWGSARGLGPALDEIHFRVLRSMAEREAQVADGRVRVATALSDTAAGRLASDPLLATFEAPAAGDEAVAIQRSVRGIDSARPAPLSAAWVTVVGGAGG